MPTISGENAKSIREPMKVEVTVWKRYNKTGYTNLAYYTFTNDNLLSVELNLRSDLKPIDPTLPESEISIRAYYPQDVSEEVLTIADDTVITYQAGYEGDMSPVRVFYLAERIKWADNVMTIRGVDAVHFLDSSCPPFYIGNHYCSVSGSGTSASRYTFTKQDYRTSIKPMQMLYYAFCDVIKQGGVTLVSQPPSPASETSALASDCNGVVERQSRREIIANIMNLCRFNTSQWFTYVDAGRPKVSRDKPSPSWTISEQDCGEIKRDVDKNIVSIKAPCKTLDIAPCNPSPSGATKPGGYKANVKVGSATAFVGSGFALSFDVLTSMCFMVISRDNVPDSDFSYIMKYWSDQICYPSGGGGNALDVFQKLKYQYDSNDTEHEYGKKLLDTERAPWQNRTTAKPTEGYVADSSGGNANTQLYDEELLHDKWYGDNNNLNLDLVGGAYNLTDTTVTVSTTGSGIVAKPSKTGWSGLMKAYQTISGTSTLVNALPDQGLKALMERSNETGSFTWKGDPRMQPRDVIRFNKLDGTQEIRTIENIQLKHEGGGTIATISYRKGYV